MKGGHKFISREQGLNPHKAEEADIFSAGSTASKETCDSHQHPNTHQCHGDSFDDHGGVGWVRGEDEGQRVVVVVQLDPNAHSYQCPSAHLGRLR